jgi:hypothetical protein
MFREARFEGPPPGESVTRISLIPGDVTREAGIRA